MKKIKELLKNEKLKNILLSILLIFTLVYAFCCGFFIGTQKESIKEMENYKTVEIEKQDRQPIKQYLINTDTQDIYFSRQVVPIYILEDDVDFYILSYGFEFSLGYEIENNNIFVTDLAVRTFVYRSNYIELTDYTGIRVDEDYSTPIYYGSVNFDKVPINSLSDLQTTCSITKPYNDTFLYYDFKFDLYNLDGENVITLLEEDWKGFSYDAFTFDIGSAQLRRLSSYNGYTISVDLNYFDVTEFYTNGYTTGFDTGKQFQKDLYEKSDTALNKIWTILENGIKTALNVLSIEILPGIPLTICVIVPLIFGIIFFIWKGGAQ